MSALNKISMAIAGLFGTGAAATPLANRNYVVDGATENGPGTITAISQSWAYTTATMYYGTAGAGGAATAGLINLNTNASQAFTDTNPARCYSHQQTTASTGTLASGNLPGVCQNIEGVSKLAGRSITVSAKLWTSAPMTIPAIIATLNMGTGGSPSGNISAQKSVAWNVVGTPKRFSVRIDLPAITGNTLGTNGNDSTTVGISLPAGWVGTFYMTEFQVELCSPRSSSDLNGNGGQPTAFEYRGPQAELARVQRYYIGTPYASGINSYADVATRSITQMEFRFPVTMRAVPAISITNANLVNVTIGSIFSSTNGFNQGATATAAGFSSYTYTVNTCDARL